MQHWKKKHKNEDEEFSNEDEDVFEEQLSASKIVDVSEYLSRWFSAMFIADVATPLNFMFVAIASSVMAVKKKAHWSWPDKDKTLL